MDMLVVFFQAFWTKLRVLGQIGRSGKVLGFISSNFGPNPTAGRPPKGNNRGAIIIIIIQEKGQKGYSLVKAAKTAKSVSKASDVVGKVGDAQTAVREVAKIAKYGTSYKLATSLAGGLC